MMTDLHWPAPADRQTPSAQGFGLTPSATVGPYLSIGLFWPDGSEVYAGNDPGALTIEGTLYDGENVPVPDGMIETWQADPNGFFNHPDAPKGPREFADFRAFGRSCTDAHGRFFFRTLKPGPVPAEAGMCQAPHLDVSVFARGMLNRVVTRIYFADEIEANGADPVLESLEAHERARLLAQPHSPGRYEFDIYLQGEFETPFFSV